MKMTLINPPWLYEREMNYLPQSMGLRYLTSYLMERGHEVELIDAVQEGRTKVHERAIGKRTLRQAGLDYEEIAARVPEDTDYIGIGVPFTFLARVAEELSVVLRRSFQSPIIAGGVLPSTFPERALRFSDYVVKGEGEIVLDRLLSHENPSVINGLHSRSFSCGQAEFIRDLDAVPFPFRDNSFEAYLSFSSRGRRGKRTASLITSRGCPFDCNFCSTHPTAGYRWRSRSVDNVMDEIHVLRSRFGINHVEIEDDNFTLEKRRTTSLLEALASYNATGELQFSTPNGLRIDTLSEEQVTLMKRAGFESIYLALESGDPQILHAMNKNLSLDKVICIAESAAKNDLPVLYFFMIGYPGETRERFMNSIRFCQEIKRIGKSSFTTFLTRPYPGTQLYQVCADNGYIDMSADQEVFLGTNYAITTEDFDAAELRWRLKYANATLNDGRKQEYIL